MDVHVLTQNPVEMSVCIGTTLFSNLICVLVDIPNEMGDGEGEKREGRERRRGRRD